MSFISKRSLLLLCCRIVSIRPFRTGISLTYDFSTSTAHSRMTEFQKRVSITARNHQACEHCHGAGKVQLPPSKKVLNAYEYKCSKIKRKSLLSGDTTAHIPPPPPKSRTGKCHSCDGIGVKIIQTNAAGNDLHHEPSLRQFEPIETNQCVKDGGVIIVGGGIGGFSLALALQQRGIQVKVFEKDSCFSERTQGYGLTLQQGARTLRQLGFSYEDVGRLGVTSTSHYSFLPDKTVLGAYGRDLLDKDVEYNNSRTNIHLPRQQLRELLLDALKPNTVFWGHQFEKYQVVADSTGKACLKVLFSKKKMKQSEAVMSEVKDSLSNGNSDTIESPKMSFKDCPSKISVGGDLLVGCDGIWSVVRKQKLDSLSPRDDTRYLGVMVVLGRGTVAHELTSTDPKSCSVFQTLDGNTRIYAMPFSPTVSELSQTGETMWQLSFPIDEKAAQRLGAAGGQALLDEALRRCGSWHSPIPELLRATKPHDVTGYPAYDRPPLTPNQCRDKKVDDFDESVHGKDVKGIDDTPSSRRIETPDRLVTLLGDAAHPMSPFKGQGANQALMDAIELARRLSKVKRFLKPQDDSIEESMGSKTEAIEEALSMYENEMLSRSKLKVEASADASRFLHSEAAASAKQNVTRASAARAWLLQTHSD